MPTTKNKQTNSRPHVLTNCDRAILVALDDCDKRGERWLSVSEIVRKTDHVRLMIVHTLRDLQKRGLVCPQSPTGLFVHAWSITSAGAELIHQAQLPVLPAHQQLGLGDVA